jgi:ABC-type multidrug transport system ATPase subunit
VSSGNIVGIMGGSGAGKSTLLSVLTGLNKPTKGKVLLNNTDIHNHAQTIEGLIGYVSQDDLLVEELTVFQNLYFNAKLCFGQYTDDEIRKKTDDVLHDLGLYEIRDMKVGSPLNKKISGGQRKRLNIALEMIRQPAVLFLDEPTSGLSSRDSDNILDLLKELSLKGKLVFVVIHQPSSDIFKMFDRLLVLDKGGYLIYNGNPVDAILYFKSQINQANRDTSECTECGNVNPEQIFNIVEARVLDEQGQATDTRRISPAEWYESFKLEVSSLPSAMASPFKFSSSELKPETSNLKLETPNLKRPSRLKQFAIYAARNIFTKASDLQYIIVCLLEAPLLGLLLAYIIRYYHVSEGGYSFELNENIPIYIFVSVIIAIFIGLSVSAEEIIRDRKILKREAFLNLSRGSYLFSKTLVLFAISAIQAILFVMVGNSVTGILHQTFTYWIVLFSAWACANLMGLIISDTFKSVVTIYILIPFIVIPQLMLSGSLLRFEKLNPDISPPASVPWYGELITARWAFEALAVEQFMYNDYERIVYPYEKNMSIAEFQKNYWIVEMKNKFSEIKACVDDGKQPDPALLTFIGDEIERENKRQNVVQFSFRNECLSGISQKLIDETTMYFDQLSRYYSALYNKTAEQKDRLMSEIASDNPDSLLLLKSHYFNQSLSNMVKNNSETYRIIEYKNQFLQNYHQVYKEPEHPLIKAHFYAPVKQFFGRYYPTIWVNVMVMWCFNVFFFVALYFRWLPNLFGFFQKGKRGSFL